MKKTNDELIYDYIIISTARSVISKRLKHLPTETNKALHHHIGNHWHDINKILTLRDIRYLADHSKTGDKLHYTLIENGWRRERSIDKAQIKADTIKLINDLS